MAEGAKKTPEEYKKLIKDEDLEYFKERISVDKLFDFLTANAVITEGDKKETGEKDAEKKEENK